MTETNIHTTPTGWTITASTTIASIAAYHVQVCGGITEAADFLRVTASTIRRCLANHERPAAPVMTRAIRTLLATPLPAVDAPAAGSGTEADLLRLCGLAVAMGHDSTVLDCFIGRTLYAPPPSVAARLAELQRLWRAARDAAAGIRATTPEGVWAKGRQVAAFGFDPKWDSLDDQPMVRSLLADCAALAV